MKGRIEGRYPWRRSRYWRNQQSKRRNDWRMRRPMLIEGQVVDGLDMLEWKKKLGVHPCLLVQSMKHHGERPWVNAVETGNRQDPYTTYCNHCKIAWDSSYEPVSLTWRIRMKLGVAQREYRIVAGDKTFKVTLKIGLDDFGVMPLEQRDKRVERELAVARERFINDTFEAFDTDGHNVREDDQMHCEACSRSAKTVKVIDGEGVERMTWLWLREPQMVWRAQLFEDVRRGRFETRFQRRIDEMHATP